MTSWPRSAKQAPATSPTYPEPTTAIRIDSLPILESNKTRAALQLLGGQRNFLVSPHFPRLPGKFWGDISRTRLCRRGQPEYCSTFSAIPGGEKGPVADSPRGQDALRNGITPVSDDGHRASAPRLGN